MDLDVLSGVSGSRKTDIRSREIDSRSPTLLPIWSFRPLNYERPRLFSFLNLLFKWTKGVEDIMETSYKCDRRSRGVTPSGSTDGVRGRVPT